MMQDLAVELDHAKMVRLDNQDVMVLLLKPRIVLVLVDLGWNGQTGVLAR